MGVDDVSVQTLHARHSYDHKELRFGHRFVDILTELPTSDIVVDLRRFHEVEPDSAR